MLTMRRFPERLMLGSALAVGCKSPGFRQAELGSLGVPLRSTGSFKTLRFTPGLRG